MARVASGELGHGDNGGGGRSIDQGFECSGAAAALGFEGGADVEGSWVLFMGRVI